MKWFDLPEREAGRIYICLFVLFLGVVMLFCHIDYGKEVISGASSALFAFMQSAKAGTHSSAVNVENVNMPEGNK